MHSSSVWIRFLYCISCKGNPFRKFPDDLQSSLTIQPIGINMDIYIPTFRQQPGTE